MRDPAKFAHDQASRISNEIEGAAIVLVIDPAQSDAVHWGIVAANMGEVEQAALALLVSLIPHVTEGAADCVWCAERLERITRARAVLDPCGESQPVAGTC